MSGPNLFLLVIRPPRAPEWSRSLDVLLHELGGERLGDGVFRVPEAGPALARLRTTVANIRCAGGDAMIARGASVENGDEPEFDDGRPAR